MQNLRRSLGMMTVGSIMVIAAVGCAVAKPNRAVPENYAIALFFLGVGVMFAGVFGFSREMFGSLQQLPAMFPAANNQTGAKETDPLVVVVTAP